jgi:hypothetical protein
MFGVFRGYVHRRPPNAITNSYAMSMSFYAFLWTFYAFLCRFYAFPMRDLYPFYAVFRSGYLATDELFPRNYASSEFD